MASRPTKTPLPWFGSDSEVAAELGAKFDDCKHVTIAFCGGLAILPFLKSKFIVCNDLHAEAINFYKAARNNADDLAVLCDRTLCHPAELQHEPANDLERAWAYWARCWLGRKGMGGTERVGASLSVRWTTSGGNNANRIRAAARDLPRWADEFQRCEFTMLDCVCVLDRVKDSPQSGVYCDPPWFDAGDAYKHAFTAADHERLRDAVARFEHANVVVRYGDCDEVRELYSGFEIEQVETKTQANTRIPEVWIQRKQAV